MRNVNKGNTGGYKQIKTLDGKGWNGSIWHFTALTCIAFPFLHGAGRGLCAIWSAAVAHFVQRSVHKNLVIYFIVSLEFMQNKCFLCGTCLACSGVSSMVRNLYNEVTCIMERFPYPKHLNIKVFDCIYVHVRCFSKFSSEIYFLRGTALIMTCSWGFIKCLFQGLFEIYNCICKTHRARWRGTVIMVAFIYGVHTPPKWYMGTGDWARPARELTARK